MGYYSALAVICCLLSFCSADILKCPPSSPCQSCCSNASWACVTVPAGDHDPSLEDQAILFEHGFKGLKHVTSLAYRVVFHANTLSYPCATWCSNENKLFGFSRGFVEVMWESCMFSWRKTMGNDEPADKIKLWGYGWKNSTYPPWEHPAQNPLMGYLDIAVPYVISLSSYANHCQYVLQDQHGRLLANATTPQEPYRNGGPSYFFSLYFGGTEVTTQPVTVSYTKNLAC
jgi:hypothetical protein